jgi:hypothetical protein
LARCTTTGRRPDCAVKLTVARELERRLKNED